MPYQPFPNQPLDLSPSSHRRTSNPLGSINLRTLSPRVTRHHTNRPQRHR
jgi:hypothetical protein